MSRRLKSILLALCVIAASSKDCLNNLIGVEGNPMGPVASSMTKQLWHWMKETGDPQLGRFQKQVDLALD